MCDERYWDQVYARNEPEDVSWYEAEPRVSLALIEEAGLPPTAAILDVGGGTSELVRRLSELGYCDLAVADISQSALERARVRLGGRAERVGWMQADIRSHVFERRFDLWHDRAVFHFMVDSGDREGYLTVLRRTLRPGGHAVLATFGPDGPTMCSGLPVSRYSPDALRDLVGSGFELISSQTAQHHTPRGALQEFIYAHFRYASASRVPAR